MNKRRGIEGNTKLNLNSVFILPMVSIDYKLLTKDIINTYITDDYQVILVYELLNRDKIIEYYQDNVYFDKIIEEEDEICIFFNISKENREDFDTFKTGKYSKFTKTYKEVLSKYHGITPNQANYKASVHNALYPQDYKKKQIVERLFDAEDYKKGLKIIEEVGEVLHKPDLDKEIYKTIKEIQLQEQQNNNKVEAINEQRKGHTE